MSDIHHLIARSLQRVISTGIGALLIVAALTLLIFVEGPALAVNRWTSFPLLLLLTLFVFSSMRLKRDFPTNRSTSIRAMKGITIINLIVLTIPMVLLSIVLLLSALGAKMVDHLIGTLLVTITAIALPVFFFVSHYLAIKVLRMIRQNEKQ